MPRKPIDYSKTHFYKIVCKDLNIKDCYVGHTTDLTKRKNKHKYTCLNECSKNYNINLYQFIRENGGWENWEIILLKNESCENGMEARSRERYYKEQEHSTLNKQVPSRTPDEYTNDNYQQLQAYWHSFYETNKDRILEYQKDYRNRNTDRIKEYAETYRKNNKDYLKQTNNNYYHRKKDEINEKRKEKVECCCEAIVAKGNMSAHLKSKKHQAYLQSLQKD